MPFRFKTSNLSPGVDSDTRSVNSCILQFGAASDEFGAEGENF